MPGPVRSCPALSGTDRPLWPLPVLSCPGWSCPDPNCLALPLIQPVWRCPARPCPTLLDPARSWTALHEPAQSRPTLSILPWPTKPGSTLSCLALRCPTLPFPTLSGFTDHARSCPALFGTDQPLLDPPGPVRPCSALPDSARTCLALPGPALHIPAVPSAQLPTLSDTVWPCPVCTYIILYLLVLFLCAMHCVNSRSTVLGSRPRT